MTHTLLHKMARKIAGVVLLLCIGLYTFAPVASAQFGSFYNGGGIVSGTDSASAIQGVSDRSIRQVIGDTVNTALSYAALIAVVVIIIAGFYLILGLGDDGSKDKAKKIILYTFVGLLVLLLAKVIVDFFILLPQ